ncbi:PhoU domain-containing protein [Halorussus sp. AFM4]|uniref:PhoU domain-containing protein n=1 Tax=Halorussus sp. AFM4 TaxID=3421651 RepID=UPI003EBF221F
MTASQNERVTRKVQLAGGTTYTVSLPKEWAIEQGLEAGSSVYIEPHGDGSLLLHPQDQEDEEREYVQVPIEGLNEIHVARIIRAIYANGFQQIDLITAEELTTDQRRCVRETVGKLMGIEIMEETGTRITLKNILDTSDISLRQSVVRLKSVVLSMQRDAITSFVEQNTELARQGVITREAEADRIFAMVSGYFHRTMTSYDAVDDLGLDRPTIFECYMLAQHLERIADSAEDIANVVLQMKQSPPSKLKTEIEQLGLDVTDVVRRAVDVTLGHEDLEAVFDTLEESEKITEDLAALDQRMSNQIGLKDRWQLSILENLNRIVDNGIFIAEIAVQSAL